MVTHETPCLPPPVPNDSPLICVLPAPDSPPVSSLNSAPRSLTLPLVPLLRQCAALPAVLQTTSQAASGLSTPPTFWRRHSVKSEC